MTPSIHNLTDLQSYYDCQLANYGSIIKEPVGKNYQAMQLFTKLMLVWYHYMCTRYRISTTYYRGVELPQAGTGQGNIFSSKMCHNKSSFIIGDIKT